MIQGIGRRNFNSGLTNESLLAVAADTPTSIWLAGEGGSYYLNHSGTLADYGDDQWVEFSTADGIPATPCRDLLIQDGVWIAFGAIILNGSTIGKNSVVAAESLVKEDVEKYCVCGGIPSKKIKKLFDTR